MKRIRVILAVMLITGLSAGAVWAQGSGCGQQLLMERAMGLASESADIVNGYYIQQASQMLGCCSESALQREAINQAVSQCDAINEHYLDQARALFYCETLGR